MLTEREALNNYLERKCEIIAFDNQACDFIREYMLDKYNIPIVTTMDIITKMTLSEQTDYILFCLLDGIDVYNKTNKKKKYFTDKEIKMYSETRLEKDTIKFPIIIDCLPVASNQWIGVIDCNFLMQLRKEQMINYNINAQRTMKRIIKGEQEFYKIALNKVAVSKIRESMEANTYISNTLTLNIDPDIETDYYYDMNKKRLVINSLKAFDISDGYHRYIAMCQAKDANPDFNYKMEIRIVSFPDSKIKQFIFQEDQKTKMRKLDSTSMNMSDDANIIVERLNDDVQFNLKGQINRINGHIPLSEFASVLRGIYFKGHTKSSDNSKRLEVLKEIRTKFNQLTELDTKFLSMKYSFTDLAILVFLFTKDIPIEQIYILYEYILNNGKLKTLSQKTITATTIKELESLYEEGLHYV